METRIDKTAAETANLGIRPNPISLSVSMTPSFFTFN